MERRPRRKAARAKTARKTVRTKAPPKRRAAARRGLRPATPKIAVEIAAPPPDAGVQPTAVVMEAERLGVLPPPVVLARVDEEIPGPESEKMRVGDPDVSPLANEYSGEEVPGASTPTPDQSLVDEIGRAYGVEEEDSGALRTSSEILEKRDRQRQD